MRRLFVLLPLLGLPAGPAAAQHWNDAAPGRDLLSSTTAGFDSFRQRTMDAPSFAAGATGAAAQRPPIPILDWVPPPPQAAPGAPRQTRTPRRVTRPRAAEAAMRDPSSATGTQAARANAASEWERSLAERERELDRLRRILEEDRLRYQQGRQPQSR
jgi:hypothetical protein